MGLDYLALIYHYFSQDYLEFSAFTINLRIAANYVCRNQYLKDFDNLDSLSRLH